MARQAPVTPARRLAPRLRFTGIMQGLRPAILVVVAMTTIHATVAEFVEIQGLSATELRERFELPDSCEPSVAAMRARFEQVTVLISCDDTDAEAPSASS